MTFLSACTFTGRWILRFAAIGAAFLSALAILLFSMVGGNGISLRAFEPAIEVILAANADAEDVEIGDIRLARVDDTSTPFRIDITDLRIQSREGTDLSLPSMSMRLDSGSLLRGQALPKFIDVGGATIKIVRQDEDVTVDAAANGARSFDFGALLSGADQIGFEGALLSALTVDYQNAATGARFYVDNAAASLRKTDGVYVFRMQVPYEEYGGELSLDFFSRVEEDTFEATLTADEIPASAILPLFMGDMDDLGVSASVSGTITSYGTRSDGFQEFGVALYTEDAVLTKGAASVPIAMAAVDGVYHPQDGQVNVDRLSVEAFGSKVVTQGQIDIAPRDEGGTQIAFDFTTNEMELNPEGVFEAPLPIEDAKLIGAYDVDRRALVLEKIELGYFGRLVTTSGEISFPETPGQSLGVVATAEVQGALGVKEVLRGWPVPAGDGARRWVVANLPKAEVSKVVYNIDLPRGYLSEGGSFTEEQSDLSFKIKDATVVYVPGIAPITGLDADAKLAGNSFHIDGGGGRTGRVRVTSGRVRMNRLVPKGGPAIFEVGVKGKVPDLLSIIDQKPIDYLEKSGFSTEDFEGDGEFTVKVVRPMLVHVPQEDYEITGRGRFSNAELIGRLPGMTVDQGFGDVSLRPTGVYVTAEAAVEGIPADVTFIRRFGRRSGMELQAEAVINARAADALGLPFRRYVEGEIDLRLEAEGEQNGFDIFRIRGDMFRAGIFDDEGAQIKAPETDGMLAADFLVTEDRDAIGIDSIQVSASGLNLEGNARYSFTEGLIDLDLPRLFIQDYADLSVRIRREMERVIVKVEGDYLYAGGIISRMFSGGKDRGRTTEAPGQGGYVFDTQLHRVGLKNGVSIKDLRVRGEADAQRLTNLSGTATFQAGGDLTVGLQPDIGGVGRELRVIADRTGLVLKGLFGIDSLSAGPGTFSAVLIDGGPLAGSFRAEQIVVRNAPTVARLFSVGSLDGLSNVLNGEGLSFDLMTGDLQIDNGVMRFVDARLTGSALGLSANGEVELSGDKISLFGAVAPAYQVNSMLGAIPGVGDLLVSRRGEGIFAMAYRVEGEVSEPTVSVNSLAALAPGVIRRIFEPVTRKRPTTDEVLSAAEEVVLELEAVEFLSTPELLREYNINRAESLPDSPNPR